MTAKSQHSSSKRRSAAARPSFRPALEGLEDRMVMSSQTGIMSAPALMAATAVQRSEVPPPVVALTLDQASAHKVIVMGKAAQDDWEARVSTVSLSGTNLGGPAPLIRLRRIVGEAALPNAGERPVVQVSEIVVTKPTDAYFSQSSITNLAHLETLAGGTAPVAFDRPTESVSLN
jgi:hypothetical protein